MALEASVTLEVIDGYDDLTEWFITECKRRILQIGEALSLLKDLEHRWDTSVALRIWLSTDPIIGGCYLLAIWLEKENMPVIEIVDNDDKHIAWVHLSGFKCFGQKEFTERAMLVLDAFKRAS